MPLQGPDEGASPALPYSAWRDTYETLHLWTQIVGKIRLSLAPWLNHSWHVAHYVTARGLTTSPIAYGERIFQIDFDFIDHMLYVRASDGSQRLSVRSERLAFLRLLFKRPSAQGIGEPAATNAEGRISSSE
jgi:hypothetical protein